ncbi:MAG: hypothetical protein HDR06_03530 [Lachnospiraceae bacterium]|nr:hypothetical protein [Lachnospiraceae bacterium]
MEGRIESKEFAKGNKGIIKVWQRITDTIPVHLMKFINDGVGYQTERQYAYKLMEKRAYGLPYTDGHRKILTCSMRRRGETKEYTIDIRNVRIHCFGTNVGFLVYDVWYSEEMSYDDLLEFNFLFKKVGMSNIEIKNAILLDNLENRTYLYALSENLIANGLEDVELFFHANNVIRMESNVFSIFCDNDKNMIDNKLFHLGHSYTKEYEYNISNNDDFQKYHPYSYIHWGYCQDGITCIYYDTCNFTLNDLNGKLQNDYYFMYLVLLHQRYTALSLINEMMNCRRADPDEWRKIQYRLTEYRMEYSFHIISDEMTYHRIYKDVRAILSIDELENDLKEISDRMYMLQSEKQREKEEADANYRGWRTDIVLGILSLLTVFSAFVDSTDILNRWCAVSEGKVHLIWLYYVIYAIIGCVAILTIVVLMDSFRQYIYKKMQKKHKEKIKR